MKLRFIREKKTFYFNRLVRNTLGRDARLNVPRITTHNTGGGIFIFRRNSDDLDDWSFA